MKTVEVREQVRLPLRRCVELVLSGVRFRLFRAAITVGIIALAVAFLMTMVSESLIGRRVAEAVRKETLPREAMLFWVGRLGGELTQEQLTADLAASTRGRRGEIDSQVVADFKDWGHLSDAQLAALTDVAVRQAEYDTYFTKTLTESERRGLVKDVKGADLYRWLLEPGHWSAFAAGVDRLKKPLPTVSGSKRTGEAEFQAFLKDWQSTAPARAAVLAGNRAPLAEARRTVLAGREPTEILARTDPGLLAAQLDKCGFHTSKAQMAMVRNRADLSYDAERIDALSRAAAFKAAFAEKFGLDPTEVDQESLFAKLASSAGATWFVTETDKTAGLVDPRLSDSGIQEAAAASLPIAESDLAMTLAETTTNPEIAAEIALLGQLNADQVRVLAPVARREKKYVDFFDVLPAEKREELLPGGKLTHDWLAGLSKADALGAFLSQLATVDKDRKFPDEKPAEGFAQFLQQWNQTDGLRDSIRAGRGEIFLAVQKVLHTRGPGEPDPAKLDTKALTEAMAKAGVRREITIETIEIVRRQIALVRASEKLAAMLDVPAIREWLARQIQPPKVHGRKTMSDEAWAKSLTKASLLEYAATMDGGRRLRGYLDKLTGMRPLEMTPARVEAVAQYWGREKNLSDIEAGVIANVSESSQWGFSGRTVWLLVVSFLVCVVGIANAMLMSVTERFREIATMKCLGATDRFIMLNFVLESCIQGIAGGAVGTVLGLLLGTLRGMGSYGWIAMANYPGGEIGAAAAISLVAGVVISALAAVYPAWVAARLAPMEAMRIE